MRVIALIPALMLAACAYVPADYKAGLVNGDPKKIVERVLYEQPESKRPDYVRVTDAYVEFGEGVSGSSFDTGVGTVSSYRKDVTRVYYRSMAEAKLLNRVSMKGHWYVVEPRSAQGRTLAQVYVDERQDAEKLVDALMALKALAPATE
ncbi:hypothetical protein [Cupriavidus taiwanensis]|uniref:Lipoprotein n=1 Tax=Cupriavidus taiwanensis TaxID=164546 RepID=A0A375BFY1_9BURK|nr:conserved exported hypothetical protein [Cupriavidus taiwanensis]